MKYQRKTFCVNPTPSDEYRQNWERIFNKCETTTDQPSSGTSPASPADPGTTPVSSQMDTPSASDATPTQAPVAGE